MKKYLRLLFTMVILLVPSGNIITFLVTNNVINHDSISEILYPVRGWPQKTAKQLRLWQFLYEDSIKQVLTANDTIVSNFSDFYLMLFHKYGSTDKIPESAVNDYINSNICHGLTIQKYMAWTLRSYFIEFTINNIKNPGTDNIAKNEYLTLWVMNYFQAGFYYQMAKIWIKEIGQTVEKAINIDYYTFGSLVPTVEGKEDWSKGPTGSATPLLNLDGVMKAMISDLYDAVLKNKSITVKEIT